jgi:hypothetical protein
MAYSKGFPGSKILREQFQQVSAISDVAAIAETHLQTTLAHEALAAAS